MQLKCFILLCLLLVSRLASAAFSAIPDNVPLVQGVEYLEDARHDMTLDRVVSGVDDRAWAVNEKSALNFGHTKSAFWLRFDLDNASDKQLDRLLVISYPLLDDVQATVIDRASGAHVASFHVGDYQPFNVRPYDHRVFVLPVKMPAEAQYRIYIHVVSTSSMQIPMMLWDAHAFAQSDSVKMMGYGLFFGALLIIAGYNLFLWFSVRDTSYLLYPLFIMAFSLMVFALEGLGFQYLWGEHVWWQDKCVLFLGCLVHFTAMQFSRYFLHLERLNPMLDRVARGYLAAVCFTACASIFLPYANAILVLIALTVVWPPMALTFGILNYRAGNRSARYFIMAWAALTLCVVIFALGQLALIPRTFLVGISLQIGELSEALLLSFALADRINMLQKEKAAALSYVADADKRVAGALMDSNARLQHALAVAEENQKRKDRFIMNVSHELRTPLNAISASVGQLNDVSSEEERQSLQNFIRFGADRLSTQVENLIMLAETEQTRIKPQERTFYIQSILRHAARLADAYLFNKPVEFRVELKCNPVAAYHGDDYLLLRMLMPVLENACKYTAEGSVLLQVEEAIDGIVIRVADTGTGIPDEFRAMIYDAFRQASEGYNRTHEGLGIGLTACQRIADILGVKMEMQTETCKGTTFILRVPMKADLAASPLQENKLDGAALIVEDNIVNAKVLNALVHKLGLQTEVAENGLQALERSRQRAFDVVLMDLQMPVMDGFESAEAMRREGVHCPILAVTANSDYSARMRCMEVGMNDMMAKPLNKETLKEKLNFWLHKQA